MFSLQVVFSGFALPIENNRLMQIINYEIIPGFFAPRCLIS